ncbi:MAG: hypothetical protein ACLQGV_14165 [Bryobacteraceae bacterium]
MVGGIARFLLLVALVAGSIWALGHWRGAEWVLFLVPAAWYGLIPVFRMLDRQPNLYPLKYLISAVLMFASLLLKHFAGAAFTGSRASRVEFLFGGLFLAALVAPWFETFLTDAGRERLRPAYVIDLGGGQEHLDRGAAVGVAFGCLIWVLAVLLGIFCLGRAIFG